MKKIGIAVMILAVIGVAVTAGVFVTGHPETTKVEQKHEKIKKEGKAYAGKYRMNILLDTNNKVLSGTVRAKLKNATDDDLKSICVRNWAAAILQEKTNQKKKAKAGRLLGLLLGQLFFGRFQLDSGVLGLGLGPLLLFLLLVLLALLGGLFLVGSIPAGLVLLPQAGGRLFPLSVLSEFSGALGLRAKLARSRLPGLPGHFFLCEMEPPTLDPFPGRTIKVFSDRNDLLPLDMKRASQYRWTLNWHTSLLNCGCEIGRYWPGPIRMVNRRSLSLG